MSLLISILVLYAQGTFADSQLPVVVSISKKQDFGCDRVLSLTELASKPGLQCTDFVNTFNFGELGGGLVPGANDHRPGIEVNFHNTVFRNHTVPTAEQIPYGFTQVLSPEALRSVSKLPEKLRWLEQHVRRIVIFRASATRQR